MKRRSSFNSCSATSGFTLLEVIVTVVLIGVLFAIAAPNWVAFINQQRVNSARNQVAQAIRSAQSEAQRTKSSRAVVFDNNEGQPRYAIVPAPDNPSPSSTVDKSKISNWERLGDGSIQPGTIRLSVDQGTDAARPPLLIFDSYGSVITSALPSRPPLPYTITIGVRSSENPRRCVAVTTLLGAMREGSDDTATDGCPSNRV